MDKADKDWIITKRHLGIATLLVGVAGFVGVLVLDVLRGQSDFGPTQQLALAGCAGLSVLGLTLLPLGDRPA